MAKKRGSDIEDIEESSQEPAVRQNIQEPVATHHVVQNSPPKSSLASFDLFWSSCVKNGTPLIKESFRMHLKSMGWLEKPEKWIEGALHFGLEFDKK
jgi:hypothetical protein